MRPLTRRLGAALAASVLVTCGACSGTDEALEATADSSSRARTAQTDTPAPAAAARAVRAAAETPQRMQSVTMEMTTTVDGDEVSRMSGVTSLDGTSSDLTMSTPVGDMRTLMVDGDVYLQMPDMPEGFEWVSLPLGEIAGLTGFDPAEARARGNPTRMLEALAEFSDITEIGSDTLFGVHVTGYRATISRDALLAHGMGSFADGLGDHASEMLAETYDIDVWIDDDGLPRRQSWSMELPASPGAAPTMFEASIDFPEWGAEVRISAPDPATVATIADLIPSGPRD